MRVEFNQQKNGLSACAWRVDEVDGGRRCLVIDRLHALLGQRAGVLDGLLADPAEARIDRRIVAVGRLALQHAARPELAP